METTGVVDDCSSGTSNIVDEMCTVEVVAAGKKVVPQPPTPEQDALKPLTPEQDALKLPAPEQGALKLPAPQQKFLKRLTPRHMREKEWWIQDGQIVCFLSSI